MIITLVIDRARTTNYNRVEKNVLDVINIFLPIKIYIELYYEQ